jgi:hypothetical protein
VAQQVQLSQVVAARALPLLLLTCFSCIGATEEPASEAPREVGLTESPVVGGTTAEACQWPSTVSVNAWGSCTGTLIHSRIVTTAAHCLTGTQATIFFGGGKGAPGAFSLSARCKAGAQGTRGANTNKDWAYCVLPEDDRVKQIPVTPPLVGCEADKDLKAGLNAWVVGFGTTSSAGMGAGVKRQVGVKINAIDKAGPGTLDVGDAQQGACHGDSGGPIYVRVGDETHDYGYRVVGSTSGAGAARCDCSCSTVYINIANHVKAIEENENIDVTPCTDATGAFAPGPACSAMMSAPQNGTGTFPACTVPLTTGPIESCGVGNPAATAGSGAAVGGATAGAAAGGGAVVGASGAAARSGAGGLVSAGARGLAGSSAGATGASVAAGSAAGTAALAPRAGTSSAASGRGGLATVGSAGTPLGTVAQGVTAAGANAFGMMPPAAESKGCQVARVGDTGTPTWLAAGALAVMLGWRQRRRRVVQIS